MQHLGKSVLIALYGFTSEVAITKRQTKLHFSTSEKLGFSEKTDAPQLKKSTNI